jgi:Heterokaryon incompatibility protein (HET)
MAPRWLSRKDPDHTSRALFLAGLRKSERNELCSRCTKYDFRNIFASSEEYPPIKWTERVPLAHIQKHSSCPFCRLIFETVSTTAARAEPQRSLDSFTDDQGRVWLEQERHESWYDTRKGVQHYVSQVAIQDCSNRRYLIHSIPGPGFDDPNKSFDCYLRGRKLGETFSIALLKIWLQSCADFHGGSCSSAIDVNEKKSQLIGKDFRLIDIENECIVLAPESDFEYFALSYVWGGPTVPQLKLQQSTKHRLVELGGLSNNYTDIPTTIKDAMTLCKLLGQRYLWVDALCIYQDNLEDQILQISRMQKIYEHSDLTIVCAYGGDTWAGLPGISTRSHQQHIEVVQGLYLGNKLPDLDESILTSIWATRAWTMQERYFSKRLLFFTKHQIYFQCREVTWLEDKILEVQPYIDIGDEEFQQRESQRNFENFYMPL